MQRIEIDRTNFKKYVELKKKVNELNNTKRILEQKRIVDNNDYCDYIRNNLFIKDELRYEIDYDHLFLVSYYNKKINVIDIKLEGISAEISELFD